MKPGSNIAASRLAVWKCTLPPSVSLHNTNSGTEEEEEEVTTSFSSFTSTAQEISFADPPPWSAIIGEPRRIRTVTAETHIRQVNTDTRPTFTSTYSHRVADMKRFQLMVAKMRRGGRDPRAVPWKPPEWPTDIGEFGDETEFKFRLYLILFHISNRYYFYYYYHHILIYLYIQY